MSKYSRQYVADVVMSEGLGYAIQHYMPSASIEDEQLAFFWKQASEALDAIDQILEPYYD